MAPMRTAILTVSTSVAAGHTEDASGAALADHAQAAGAEVVARDVLPDDRAAIEDWLRRQAAAGASLIFTTGGTGLTDDDVTHLTGYNAELGEFPAVMRKSEAVALGDPVMPVFDGLGG